MARRRYRSSSRFSWPKYVPVADRRRAAAKFTKAQAAKGCPLEPVVTPGGRTITKTFWGTAWSDNLEHCCDHGRLSRGRTYVRNGSVVDLRVSPGAVDAQVAGSSIYTVRLQIEPLDAVRWRRICEDCSGGIDSLVELLAGRFADGVMQVLTRAETGMFPEPHEIMVSCSCPDYATMCKHVVAVLHGVGVRLDERPELLFTLRQVDQNDLISRGAAGLDQAMAAAPLAAELDGEDLGAMFGIELEAGPEGESPGERPGRNGVAARRTTQRVSAAPEKPAKRTTTKQMTAKRSTAKRTTAKQTTAAKPARRRQTKPAPDPFVTAAELRDRGVPPHVFQGWLRSGLLEHSGERGIYRRCAESEELVRRYLARGEH